MRETTMMRNSKYIAMALGAALLLAGCSGKSPTAPKPTPIPSFNISLTPEATSARAGESVLVTARVTSGSANAFMVSACSRSTIARGVLAGTSMPFQNV